jgi:outer membrane protein
MSTPNKSFRRKSVLINLMVWKFLFSYACLAKADELVGFYYEAIQNDKQLQSDRLTLDSTKEIINIGRSKLLPNLSSTNTFSRENTRIHYKQPDLYDEDSSRQLSARLALVQPLLDFPAWFDYSSSKAQTQKGYIDFAAAEQDLILRVIQNYLSFLRSKADFELYRQEQQSYKDFLDLAQKRLKAGIASIIDVHEAEAAYNLAEATTIRASYNHSTALENMNIISGKGFSGSKQISDRYPKALPSPIDVDEWIQTSLSNNLQIRSQRMHTKALDFIAKGAKAQNYPKVEAGIGYQGASNIHSSRLQESNTEQHGASVYVSVIVPIYSGGGINASARKAGADWSQSGEVELLLQRNIRATVINAYNSIKLNIESIAIYDRAITSNGKGLDATIIGYRIGSRNFSDVLISQRQLFQARRERLNSLHEMIFNTTLLKQAAGTLSFADLVYIDQWLE